LVACARDEVREEVAVDEQAANRDSGYNTVSRKLSELTPPSLAARGRNLVSARFQCLAQGLDIQGLRSLAPRETGLLLEQVLLQPSHLDESRPFLLRKLGVDEYELRTDRLARQREDGTSRAGRVKAPISSADPTLRMASHPKNEEPSSALPAKGQRIELLRLKTGVRLRGTVFYSDHLQILVKWDNGRSQSLRPGVDRFRIVG
jgi:hypothetical protein